MANIINQYGQVKLGVRYTSAPLTSTLWTSVYGVWNGDTLGTSLDDSIRAAYNAENNANDALGTYNGTAGGALTYSTGKIGNAFDFNGTNAFVELPENSLSLSTNFALSFWMFTRANGTTTVISNFGNDGINRGFYIDQDGTNALRFVAFNNTSAIVTSTTGTIQLNQWQHFVFNCNNGVGQWYINGSSIGSPTNISPTYISNSKPLIGAFRNGNTGGKSTYRNMKLDEFTVWNKVLTASEITSLYNTGTGAEYPFSSQTLPTPKDSVGTNHGTLMNGTTFTTGKIGQAFLFDGVNDYVALPSNSLNFTGDFSVSLWANFNALWTATRYLIESTGFGNNTSPQEGTSGWMLYHFNGYLYFNNYNDNSNVQLSTNVINTANTWYHIVISSTSSGMKIYINGTLVVSNTTTQRPNYRKTVYPRIGTSRNLNNNFSGKIDAMTLWTRGLTSTEVTELYNSGTGKQYPN